MILLCWAHGEPAKSCPQPHRVRMEQNCGVASTQRELGDHQFSPFRLQMNQGRPESWMVSCWRITWIGGCMSNLESSPASSKFATCTVQTHPLIFRTSFDFSPYGQLKDDWLYQLEQPSWGPHKWSVSNGFHSVPPTHWEPPRNLCWHPVILLSLTRSGQPLSVT